MPGKVRLIQAGLVVMCLGWGALAALMVGQHASAANDMSAVSEPLSLDAQQIYQSLADADVTVSTGYLFGRTAPFDYRQRYQLEIGRGPDTAGTVFGHLETDLKDAIHADQAVFASNAAGGSDAFGGLQIGVAVLAVLMAAGSAWGLSRRLAEYR